MIGHDSIISYLIIKGRQVLRGMDFDKINEYVSLNAIIPFG